MHGAGAPRGVLNAPYPSSFGYVYCRYSIATASPLPRHRRAAANGPPAHLEGIVRRSDQSAEYVLDRMGVSASACDTAWLHHESDRVCVKLCRAVAPLSLEAQYNCVSSLRSLFASCPICAVCTA